MGTEESEIGVMGVMKQVSEILNSAANACSHFSSLSSSNKHTAAGFPLNADSANAST